MGNKAGAMDVSSESPDLCLLGFTSVRRHLFPISNDQSKGLPFSFFRGELLRDSEEMTLTGLSEEDGRWFYSAFFNLCPLLSSDSLKFVTFVIFIFRK